MISAIFAATVLFMQAAPAAAPSAAPPTAPSAAPSGSRAVSGVTVTSKKAEADKDPNQVICHSEPVIGSMFPTKVCATRREMNERRQQGKDQTQDFQRSLITGAQPH